MAANEHPLLTSTSYGSWQAISEVEEGDIVWAHDPETGEEGPRSVVGLIQEPGTKDLVTLTINGDSLTATAGHPFWSASRGAWIDASEIRIGERLLQDDGDEVIVEAIDRFTLVKTVYNFEVQGLHTYFVEADGEGVLVHNCNVPAAHSDILDGLTYGKAKPSKWTGGTFREVSKKNDDGSVSKWLETRDTSGNLLQVRHELGPIHYHEVFDSNGIMKEQWLSWWEKGVRR